MKKLKNPYTRFKSYNCFGCSPDNILGLKMEFYNDGEKLIAKWIPSHQFEGYLNVLHGGIQATLLDEISGWVVNTKAQTSGVTMSMEIKFLKPVHVDQGEITIHAWVKEINRKIATIESELYNSVNEKCASAIVKYFLFSEEQAKEKLNYTGKESFYE
ncbi:MAG: PaaI family thioesterase [Bacteroidota bacterium]